ncbi:MAG TPA: acyl-CoA carboxylase subunit epsilon [Micromonosporaceae bacterium]
MDNEPLLRVVRGAPTPEELAALVGVLWARRQAALAAVTAAQPAVPRSRWRASAAPRPGRMPAPGRGAWSHTH